MRKVIFGINLSLDGCCDHTQYIPDEELLDHWTRQMREVDLLVFGRKTYELMVPFWPDMAKDHSGPTRGMNDFAKAFDSVDQIVVFSRSLEKAEGPKTRIVRTDPGDEIRKLKQEPGGNISLGGVDIPSRLIALGLVDEYHFVVQPVLVGDGRRLLEGIHLPKSRQLKLVDSKTFQSGCVALRYVKQ